MHELQLIERHALLHLRVFTRHGALDDRLDKLKVAPAEGEGVGAERRLERDEADGPHVGSEAVGVAAQALG